MQISEIAEPPPPSVFAPALIHSGALRGSRMIGAPPPCRLLSLTHPQLPSDGGTYGHDMECVISWLKRILFERCIVSTDARELILITFRTHS